MSEETPLPRYAYPPLVVPDADAVAARIAEVLQQAYDRVEAEKERLLALVEGDARWPRIRDRLAAYQEAAEQYQAVARQEAEHIVALVQGQYANGMAVAAASVGVQSTWAQGHRAVLALLASDTYEDVLRRSEEFGRTSAAFARQVRRIAREEMPFQATGGKTARDAAKAARERLEAMRVAAVTYADGSEHSIRSYTEMLARTKGRVAFNSGTVNGYHEAGVEYLEVFDGGTCGWSSHEDTDKANGTIRTIEQCSTYLISHPNCRRSFGARPDVTKATAAVARPLQDLQPYVDEAYEQAVIERAAREAVRPAQRRRDARWG